MSLIIEVKVTPSSGRQKFVKDKSGGIKCFLKSAPEDGKANEELIKLLAKKLSILKNDIKLILGATSRRKRIKIDADITLEQLMEKLQI